MFIPYIVNDLQIFTEPTNAQFYYYVFQWKQQLQVSVKHNNIHFDVSVTVHHRYK